MDETLISTTSPGQNGLGSNKEVLDIPQSSWTRASPSVVLGLYLGKTYTGGEFYPSVGLQSAYSTVLSD